MKTNVEVLEKQERELTVCDSCGREVDDDGQTCECDFCSVCAPSYTDPNVPQDVLTVDEWSEGEGYTPEMDFRDMKWCMRFLYVSSLSTILLLSYRGPFSAGSAEAWALAIGLVCVVISTMVAEICFWTFKDRCVRTLEDRGDQR